MAYNPNNPNGQDTSANSAPVVVASDQSAIPVTANAGTNLNTSALTLDSTVAKDSSLSTLNTSVNTLLKPASTLAAVTTVGTVSAVTAITNALPAGTNNIGDVDVLSLPAITGTVTANAGTNLNTSALALDSTVAKDSSITTTNTQIGIVTETAPGTDTASSGLNGRLQRIAQRITSLITAVGSPFQAGGSIGNTSFAATQSTASNLKVEAAIASA